MFLFQQLSWPWIWLGILIVHQTIVAESNIGWPENILKCMNKSLTWSGSRAQKYIVRHSNTVVPLVELIMWRLKTNVSILLLTRTVYLWALEPLHGRFLFIHTQADFFSRNFYIMNYVRNYGYIPEWFDLNYIV